MWWSGMERTDFVCLRIHLSNQWYSQCLPGGSGGSPSSSSSSSSARPTTTSTSSSAPVPTSPTIGVTGTGKTTRYWDCCKPSCAWPGKAAVTQPVNTCNAANQILSDSGVKSACDNTGGSYGSAYMCSNQQPWVVNDNLAYGFAAVNIQGKTESSWCCSCYELSFTTGPAAGKKMIVQATNTGADLGNNHFDIAMPGGGVGIFNACSTQYNAGTDGWGARYGGVSSRDQCSVIPDAIRQGCTWRWDWWNGSDNPDVSFREVACPAEIVAKTGCRRL
ncbi:hypothetical protein BJ508DRAFT_118777 [Ascobolus immersus RN42]|uniref:Cellulase n=1 Tax=Ascobolus immersus RN42 TaxID=1160509 RepID=A0A3N4IA92_ASCIM|nr:hypothetical protein BJ508DRAFT_118777 [Ascobolus immersus RN42]